MIWAEENQWMLEWFDKTLAKLWAIHRLNPKDTESQRKVSEGIVNFLVTKRLPERANSYRDNPVLSVVVLDLSVIVLNDKVNQSVLKDALEIRLSQSTS